MKAFILAAGFGTRLRPVTDDIPKPLVQVNGRSLLWRTLDNLREFGVRDVVVNSHYLAEKIEEHVAEYIRTYSDMRVHVSFEKDVLDTGGGVLHALDFFNDDEPFFVIAGDNMWVDDDVIHTYGGALERLAQGWDGQKMDIFTLMQPVSRMSLTQGVGDYDMLDSGKVRRSLDKTGSHMWTNIRLNHPRIFEGIDKKAFSFLELMDEAERKGRFYALEHQGEWHHISTPEDLRAVDAHIRGIERGKSV